MKRRFCLLALLCPMLIFGQVRTLTVGDTVPANLIARLPATSVQENGLIILDFWATWCGSCSKGMLVLDSLRNQFKDRFDAIVINSYHTQDSNEEVEEHRQRFAQKFCMEFPFSGLVNDTVFLKAFPHKYIPHYIWLQDGVVRGITDTDELTPENVRNVLTDPKFVLRMRKEETAHSTRRR